MSLYLLQYVNKIIQLVLITVISSFSISTNRDKELVVTSFNIETKIIPETEIAFTSLGTYYGSMTGYGPDCSTCSGKGYTGCRTREGNYHNLITDGANYIDAEYGEVHILAASYKVFNCGTIIMVDNGRGDPFLGIVLDSGSAMQKQWNKYQKILIDIAFQTEKDPAIYSMTQRDTVQYDVIRRGW